MKSQNKRRAFSPDLHAPLYLDSPTNKGLVVFIHGFMGSPRQFDRLAEVINREGYSVAALLLPGHGGSTKAFVSSTFLNWQSHVDQEVERFARDHENIWLVGHSMGGLLAINAAIRYSANIRGLFTIATPFRLVTFSIRSTKIYMRLLLSRKGSPIKNAYLASCGIQTSPGLLLRATKPAAEVKKLVQAARENLPNIRAPVKAVYSISDELTSIGSLDILTAELTGTDFDQVLLTDSSHVYYPEHEFARIEQALVSMVLA